MIKLFTAEAFRDYLVKEPIDLNTFDNNGVVVLQPTSCNLDITLNDEWRLTLVHPYDDEGRYTYIQKGSVLKLPCKVAREQTSEEQLYRVYSVRDSFDGLEALAYPIAMDSVYETPIYYHEWKKETAKQIADSLSLINPKYTVTTNIKTNAVRSIFASESNLQSLIVGDSDYSFVSQFGAEVVYDNFTYILNRPIGNSKDNAGGAKVFYAANMAGIEITEDTSELITRVYPMSAEGTRYTDEDENYAYVDSTEIDKYPIVYARVVKYDNISIVEEHTSEEKVPQNELQKLTQQCKAAVKSRVRKLSETYLKYARMGNWDHKKFAKFAYVDDGNQPYLNDFKWQYDGVGHYFGNGKGHYIKDGWVEDASNKHYWCGSDGYWDSTYDDTTHVWQWYSDAKGKWYGYKSGNTTISYCKNQWIKCRNPENVSEKIWCWFDKEGYYVADTDSSDAYKVSKYHNPHNPNPNPPYDEFKDRFRLPFGYIFYSYTDAVEYLKDQALIDISSEYDTLMASINAAADINEPDPSEQSAAKQTVWNLFADAIQQGFKWVETTKIAEWDWRETTSTTTDGEKNYLKDYAWHEEYVDANKKIVPKAQSVGTAWWYGYLEKQGDKKIYHCIKKGWVEESRSKHYWMDADGWWDKTYDDNTDWDWQISTSGDDWYGSKTLSDNYAANQWIYDTQYGKWYWLDENGLWTQDKPKWSFGTQDNKTDKVYLGWHKVGNTWWWFDEQGYIDEKLAYCDVFQWHSEKYTVDGVEKERYYYGDEEGHTFKDCWIEDSTGVHKWVDTEGYYYEEEDSSDSGSDDSEDTDDTDETTETTSDSSSDDEGDDDSSKDDRPGPSKGSVHPDVSYDNENWSWHGETVDDGDGKTHTRWWYGRYYQNSKGEEDTSTKRFYPVNQYLYVTENKAWYWFGENGWCKAAWVSQGTWEWHHDSGGWWYGDGSGGESTYFQGQWGKVDSKWYFFNCDGYADPYTDDYESSKNESNTSATLETNRDGINRVYDDSSVGSSSTTADYNENREGVQAWIQPAFIEDIRKTVNEQYAKLRQKLNEKLKAQALATLNYYQYPTLTIDVDLALLERLEGYEQYAFLHDMYLGDWLTVYYKERGLDQLQLRIVGGTYDCIEQKFTDLVIGSPKNVIYRKTAGLLIKGNHIVEGSDTDVLETGYAGARTKYLEVSGRLQYLEG